MHTNLKDIVIAVSFALFIGIILAVIVETAAFGDVHIDSFISSFSN